jgi:glycosyltransferase involved in cell wall biosynthesis
VTVPFVSVVIPAYNHERFVAEAIQSVLRQTWQDLELIIVNDGSTDRTGEIARSFTDPRIRYFEQRNAGAHAAINFGMGLGRGRIKTILNSDDVYRPERLNFLIEQTTNRNSFLAFTNLRYIDADARPIPDSIRQWLVPIETTYRQTGSVAQALLMGNLAVTTSNFFLSAEAANCIGPMCDQRYAHDYDYLLRALATPGVACLYFPDAPLLDYRIHGTNTVLENAPQCLVEAIATLVAHAPRLAETPRDAQLMSAALGQAQGVSDYLLSISSLGWKLSETLRRGKEHARQVRRSLGRILGTSRRDK